MYVSEIRVDGTRLDKLEDYRVVEETEKLILKHEGKTLKEIFNPSRDAEKLMRAIEDVEGFEVVTLKVPLKTLRYRTPSGTNFIVSDTFEFVRVLTMSNDFDSHREKTKDVAGLLAENMILEGEPVCEREERVYC